MAQRAKDKQISAEGIAVQFPWTGGEKAEGVTEMLACHSRRKQAELCQGCRAESGGQKMPQQAIPPATTFQQYSGTT
jgi:hypothetical protein